MNSSIEQSQPPLFKEAFRFWLKLGFISFGGPAGQIAIMHREVVENRRWIDESRFLHALNFCMLQEFGPAFLAWEHETCWDEI